MNSDILLSICIPTFNRAGYLKKTLGSITAQSDFDHRVEIVVSDNCSDDDTENVVSEFRQSFANIRYHRNDLNIRDENFIQALSLGTGRYLKLLNDTAVFKPGCLSEMLQVIQQNLTDEPVLYYANGTNKARNGLVTYHDLNSFLRDVSFYVTWIVTIGMWKSHFDGIENKSKGIELNLVQTILLFNEIVERKKVIVDFREHFFVEEVKNKGGYNLIRVFVENYLGKILFNYLKSGEISHSVYFFEKVKLLRFFLMPWLLRLQKQDSDYKINTKGSMNILLKYYGFNPLFYILMIKLKTDLLIEKFFK